MGLLSNLLPGVRDLRAPLVAGSVWLCAIWLAVHPSTPDKAHATGIWKSLLQLDGVLSAVGRGAAIAFAVYLLGSISDAVITGVSRWLERCVGYYQMFKEWDIGKLPRPVRFLLVVSMGVWMATFKSKGETPPGGRRDLLTGAGEKALQDFVGERLRQVTRPLYDAGASGEDVDRLISREIPHVSLPTYKIRWSELRKEQPPAPHRLVGVVVSEFGLIRRRLIGKEPELFSEIDRMRSEAELREAIAIPLLALALVVAFRVHGIGPTLGWAALGFALATLLFWQARLRRQDAGHALVDALVIQRVDAPVLDRVQTAVDAERVRLEAQTSSQGQQASSDGPPDKAGTRKSQGRGGRSGHAAATGTTRKG
jgi:hypothetical protein